MKLVDFAMQMELDGKAYYEKMREMTPIVGLQKLFSILAADEQKHFSALQNLRSGVGREMTDSSSLEEAKTIFSTLVIEDSDIENMRSKLDLYRHAMRMEADSIRLYEDIAREESKDGDPVFVSVAKRILNEEKKHYSSIENIHDLIAASERMIPWRDFQGIREIIK